MTPSGMRAATLRLSLELDGSLVMGEDRLRLQNVRFDGRDFAFSLEGMPGDFEYSGIWQGAAMRGLLSIDGEKIADFTGAKLDDGPSEYFDDARR